MVSSIVLCIGVHLFLVSSSKSARSRVFAFSTPSSADRSCHSRIRGGHLPPASSREASSSSSSFHAPTTSAGAAAGAAAGVVRQDDDDDVNYDGDVTTIPSSGSSGGSIVIHDGIEPPPKQQQLPEDRPIVPTTTTTTTTTTSGRVDVLLNRNAKDVNSEIVKSVEDAVSMYANVNVHVTSTMEQAAAAVGEMAKDPPSLIIALGGDGTLTTLLQLLWDSGMDTSASARRRRPDDGGDADDGSSTTTSHDHDESSIHPPSSATRRRRFPPIGYIAQGTGNALGSVVGARPTRVRNRMQRWRTTILQRPTFRGGASRKLSSLTETLHQLVGTVGRLQQQPTNGTMQTFDVVELPMIRVTTAVSDDRRRQRTERSELCFFSGVGFDSLMLQDFKDLQEWTSDETRPLRRMCKDALSSIFGYCVALVTRTLPGCIQDRKHLIRVRVSTSDPGGTVWIDHRRGDLVRGVEHRLLYQGEAGIVAAGSAPFYGGGLRLFPFARMTTDGMQLRVGRIHPLRGAMNIPRIFRGSYRDKRDESFGCLDFMGRHFRIDILSPEGGYPVQHSGDFVGTSDRVEYRMMGDLLHPIRFVTLLPPRVVVDDDDGTSSL